MEEWEVEENEKRGVERGRDGKKERMKKMRRREWRMEGMG